MSENGHGPVLSRSNGVTIEIDRELCFGFGDCLEAAPALFELDGESKSVVIDPEAYELDTVLLAAQDCPVNAIIVVDAETGEQRYP
ncbi:MAG: ferredoxin [Thermoleophilaceae bacterium]